MGFWSWWVERPSRVHLEIRTKEITPEAANAIKSVLNGESVEKWEERQKAKHGV